MKFMLKGCIELSGNLPENATSEIEKFLSDIYGKVFLKERSTLPLLTDLEIIQKFKNCCKFSFSSMSEEQINEIISTINHLESLEDVSEIFTILRSE
ncbi:MAG: hypothetical protein QXV04_04580 [Desulfurococcaceae archaeon]